jgi:hypothetical protein
MYVCLHVRSMLGVCLLPCWPCMSVVCLSVLVGMLGVGVRVWGLLSATFLFTSHLDCDGLIPSHLWAAGYARTPILWQQWRTTEALHGT